MARVAERGFLLEVLEVRSVVDYAHGELSKPSAYARCFPQLPHLTRSATGVARAFIGCSPKLVM